MWGGTGARRGAEAEAVTIGVATRGRPELFSDEQREQIRGEARKAHAVLGVAETRFFDFPAPALDTVPRYKLARAIGEVVRDVQPATLYIPHHGDIHSDHLHLHHAALVAARPLATCPVRRILAYETVSETEWAPPHSDAPFYPTCFIDISEHLPKKLEAMACFESQLREPPDARSLRNLEALARFRGATIARDAAEAFVLIREIVS
ncbi:MAG: PIG-L family deacetylase [Planctomycetes bacterium]|nr:PIG-L family deacetylase [Planctomycetota bacterium]